MLTPRTRWACSARTALVMALLFALSVSPVLVAQGQPALTKAEKSTFRKITGEWVKLGRWCVSKELGKQARLCADKAQAADSSAFGLKTLREKAQKCPDTPSVADNEHLLDSWNKKLAGARRKVAAYYDKLFGAGLKLSDPELRKRFDKYLWSALELCPTKKRWKTTLSVVESSVRAKDTDRAARLAEKALALKPPEKLTVRFKQALDAAAIDKLVLRTASSHPIKYYFSLPRGFKRTQGRKWPVLICVDGAGSNFSGIAEGYRQKRGNLPYMVVSPCTFANTNKVEGKMIEKYRKFYSDDVIAKGNTQRLDWDERGILTIVKDLQADYDAQSRVYVTGFSGGGNATYMMIFKHPDLLNGAAPACANFGARGYARLKDKFTEEDRNFPIHLITGEKDPHREHTHGNKNIPGIEPQTDSVVRLLKQLGYPNYKRTMVPGMKHSAAHQHVIDTFKPYWEGRKKRTDKLD